MERLTIATQRFRKSCARIHLTTLGICRGIRRWRQRPSDDTSASGIKYPGSWDIAGVRKTWAIFQRNKLPESFGRAERKFAFSSDSEIERFASRLFAFEIRRQHGRAFGSVATPRLGYRGKINAVYTGNYTLHPSFTGMREDGSGNSIRRRKLPCEKSASVITRHCNFHRVTFNLFRNCKLQLKWRKSYVCLTWLRYLCAI